MNAVNLINLFVLEVRLTKTLHSHSSHHHHHHQNVKNCNQNDDDDIAKVGEWRGFLSPTDRQYIEQLGLNQLM